MSSALDKDYAVQTGTKKKRLFLVRKDVMDRHQSAERGKLKPIDTDTTHRPNPAKKPSNSETRGRKRSIKEGLQRLSRAPHNVLRRASQRFGRSMHLTRGNAKAKEMTVAVPGRRIEGDGVVVHVMLTSSHGTSAAVTYRYTVSVEDAELIAQGVTLGHLAPEAALEEPTPRTVAGTGREGWESEGEISVAPADLRPKREFVAVGRYSDFEKLRRQLLPKFADISRITFPDKSRFLKHDTSAAAQTARCEQLGQWLHGVLVLVNKQPQGIQNKDLQKFLKPPQP